MAKTGQIWNIKLLIRLLHNTILKYVIIHAQTICIATTLIMCMMIRKISISFVAKTDR